MLTAFARFGERAATIVPTPGIEGDRRPGKGVRGSGGPRSMPRQRSDNVYAASAGGAPGANLYLPAAILLINSSTRQLSCSFS
jgi:hypothetical protein